MGKKKHKRIGIIGYGQIGSSLYEQVRENTAADFEVACVFETDPETRACVPEEVSCESLDALVAADPDLVVEAAHPDAVRRYAERVLAATDLMIMSVSALGDPALEATIRRACTRHGTCLYIPHGATLGLDGLRDGLSIWEEVAITMRKNPRNLNFDAAPELRPPEGAATTTVYDGPTRGILPLFPKNVNSHATLALATMGLDHTRSILISDPASDESVIEIDATGGGTAIHIERRNPIKGVTGKLTILSVLESIKNVMGRDDVIKPC